MHPTVISTVSKRVESLVSQPARDPQRVVLEIIIGITFLIIPASIIALLAEPTPANMMLGALMGALPATGWATIRKQLFLARLYNTNDTPEI